MPTLIAAASFSIGKHEETLQRRDNNKKNHRKNWVKSRVGFSFGNRDRVDVFGIGTQSYLYCRPLRFYDSIQSLSSSFIVSHVLRLFLLSLQLVVAGLRWGGWLGCCCCWWCTVQAHKCVRRRLVPEPCRMLIEPQQRTLLPRSRLRSERPCASTPFDCVLCVASLYFI